MAASAPRWRCCPANLTPVQADNLPLNTRLCVLGLRHVVVRRSQIAALRPLPHSDFLPWQEEFMALFYPFCIHDPEGVTDSSRGLSEATPPDLGIMPFAP